MIGQLRLPASYFQGAQGRQPWIGDGRPVSASHALEGDDRPWSFDTYNGKHNLLAFRAFQSQGRLSQKDYGQSPLEKYDTLAAVLAAGRGSGPVSDDELVRLAPGAARWEGDPINRFEPD